MYAEADGVVRVRIPRDETAGFTSSAARLGQQIQIVQCASLIADEDRFCSLLLENFFTSLKGLPNPLFAYALQHASCVLYHCVDSEAELIVGPGLVLGGRYAGPGALKKGELVSTDSMLFLESLRLQGIADPVSPWFFTAQYRWRRLVAFDFRALVPGESAKASSFQELVVPCMNRVHMRPRQQMQENVLRAMFAAGWYPFSRLPNTLRQQLYDDFSLNHPPQHNERLILSWAAENASGIAAMAKSINAVANLQEHLALGVSHFNKADFKSAVLVLTPLLEGIARSVLRDKGQGTMGHGKLIQALATAAEQPDTKLGTALAHHLGEYLATFFFKSKSFADADVEFSRHSVLHGLCPIEALTDVRACQLLLAIDQILICLLAAEAPSRKSVQEASGDERPHSAA